MPVRIGVGADDDSLGVGADGEGIGCHIGADTAEEDVQVSLGEGSLRDRGGTEAEHAEEIGGVVVDAVVGAEGPDHAEAAVA